MLSLTFQSPQISIFQPFQYQNHKNNTKTINKNTNNRNPTNIPCFLSKTPFSTSHFHNSSNIPSSHKNPDADFTDTHSVTQCVDYDVLALWLQSCSSVKDVKRIHAIVFKCLNDLVVYVGNNLICGYLRFGMLVEAQKVFDEMPERSVVSWSAMLNGYLRLGLDDEALRLFSDFIESGIRANEKMFVCVLNLCSVRLDLELGRQIHACILKGNWRNLIVDSAIVNLYAQCGEVSSAFRAFDEMKERDVVCWTIMITACSQHGRGADAFFMFSRMLTDGFSPNEFTVCSVLKACGEEKALKFGRQLHGTIVKKIYKGDVFMRTSLLDMYAKCGEISDSREVFNGMRYKNIVTWTSIIAGYARIGLGEEAIRLFRVMKRQKISVTNLTIVSILRACGSIGAFQLGREIHAHIVKNSIQTNVHIGSTLVWFYCKCGESLMASRVLQQMPLRDVVSWTAIISGCASLGHESEALEFLKEMMEEGVEPNSFTYSSALKACANIEAVLQGKSIHSFANKTPAFSNVFVGSALIHMYSKCGYLSEATQVFDSMPERNLVSWRAMIMGYSRNGLYREALRLMYRMQAEGFEVDDFTFATVLSACGGLERDMESSSEYHLQSS